MQLGSNNSLTVGTPIGKKLLQITALVGFLICIILLKDHLTLHSGFGAGQLPCDINTTFNCSKVATSSYSELFGIPIAALGLGYYSFVAVSGVSGGYLLLLTGLSLLLSLTLFLISKFIIGAFCLYCIGLYLINIILFGLAIILYKNRDMLSWLRLIISGILSGIVALASPDLLIQYIGQRLPKDSQSQKDSINIFPHNYRGGDSASKHEVVLFSDFECPACKAIHNLLQEIKGQGASFSLIFKHFPLDTSCNKYLGKPLHQNACFLSKVAVCAGEQGRFYEMHDFIFAMPSLDANLTPTDVALRLYQPLPLLQLDRPKIENCVASSEVDAAIKADIKEGIRLGVTGTPSIWIDGVRIKEVTKERLSELLH